MGCGKSSSAVQHRFELVSIDVTSKRCGEDLIRGTPIVVFITDGYHVKEAALTHKRRDAAVAEF